MHSTMHQSSPQTHHPYYSHTGNSNNIPSEIMLNQQWRRDLPTSWHPNINQTNTKEACNLMEVSNAMNQFMKESEEKESMLKTEVEELRRNLSTSKENHKREMNQSERTLKEEFAREKQALILKHQEETSKLERELFVRNEEVKSTKKENERLTKTLGTMKREHDEFRTQTNNMVKISNKINETKRLQTELNEREVTIRDLQGEISQLKRQDYENKQVKGRCEKLVHARELEIYHKNVTIQNLQKDLQAKTDELNGMIKASKESTDKINSLIQQDQLLTVEVAKLKDSKVRKERQVQQANNNIQFLRKECDFLQTSIQSLSQSLTKSEDENNQLKRQLEENKAKMKNLELQLKEATWNELELRKSIEEYTREEIERPYTESQIESRIKEATAKSEFKMQKKIDVITADVKMTEEKYRKCSRENEVLKEQLKQHQRKADEESQMYGRELESKNEMLSEFSKDKQILKTTITDLNSSFQNGCVELKDLREGYQRLSQEFSLLDGEYVACIKELSDTKATLESKSYELEELIAERLVLLDKERGLNCTIKELTDKISGHEELSQTLREHVSELKEKDQKSQRKTKEFSVKNQKLQEENKFMKKSMLHMEISMKEMNNELQELEENSKKQVEKNQKLSVQLEILEGRHSDNLEKQSEIKGKFDSTQKILNASYTQNEQLIKENNALKLRLQQSLKSLKLLTGENEQSKCALESMKTSNKKNNDCYVLKSLECEKLTKNYKELMEALEKMKEENIDVENSLKLVEKQEKTLEKNITTLQQKNNELTKFNEILTAKITEQQLNARKYKEHYEVANTRKEHLEAQVLEVLEEKETLQKHIETLHHKLSQCENLLCEKEEILTVLTREKAESEIQLLYLKDNLSQKDDQLTTLNRHFRDIKEKYDVESIEMTNLKRQIKYGTECWEKLKQQNKQLQNTVEELQDKQENYKSDVVSKTSTYSELKKKYEGQQREIHKLQTCNGNLKAQLHEMKGMIEGSQHKHQWITQNEEQQRNEITTLKNGMQQQQNLLDRLKEQLMQISFKNDKLVETLTEKAENIKKTTQQFTDLQKHCKTQEKEFMLQKSQTEQKIKQLTKNEKALHRQLHAAKCDLDYVKKSWDEESKRNEGIKKDLENLTKENDVLAEEKQDILKKYTEVEENYNSLQTEFLKVTNCLKKMKDERNGLASIFQLNEIEKTQFAKHIQQLQTEASKVRNQLKMRQLDDARLMEDNKQLNSIINALKYTEKLRASEYNEILEKLSQTEIKLKELKLKKTFSNSTVDDAKNNLGSSDKRRGSVYDDTISEVTNRLSKHRTLRTIEKRDFEESMRELLHDLSRKHTRATSKCENSKSEISRLKNQIKQTEKERKRNLKLKRYCEFYNDSQKQHETLFTSMNSLMNSLKKAGDDTITSTF